MGKMPMGLMAKMAMLLPIKGCITSEPDRAQAWPKR